MTTSELQTLVEGYALGAPVTVDDCAEIFADIKPRLAVGVSLDVVIYGRGTPHDPGPLRVKVTAGAWSHAIIVS